MEKLKKRLIVGSFIALLGLGLLDSLITTNDPIPSTIYLILGSVMTGTTVESLLTKFTKGK